MIKIGDELTVVVVEGDEDGVYMYEVTGTVQSITGNIVKILLENDEIMEVPLSDVLPPESMH